VAGDGGIGLVVHRLGFQDQFRGRFDGLYVLRTNSKLPMLLVGIAYGQLWRVFTSERQAASSENWRCGLLAAFETGTKSFRERTFQKGRSVGNQLPPLLVSCSRTASIFPACQLEKAARVSSRDCANKVHIARRSTLAMPAAGVLAGREQAISKSIQRLWPTMLNSMAFSTPQQRQAPEPPNFRHCLGSQADLPPVGSRHCRPHVKLNAGTSGDRPFYWRKNMFMSRCGR
jgi:hypothetical protein